MGWVGQVNGRGTYVVVHGCGAQEEDARVIRERHLIDLRAIIFHTCTVEDVVILINEPDARHPVPRLLGVLGVRRVVGVQREARPDVEEAPIRDRVLVVVPVEVAVCLPAQSTAAGQRVNAGRLRVEDGLREGKPLWLPGLGVLEAEFGGGHGGHAPESCCDC
jgi:hypothetical protein